MHPQRSPRLPTYDELGYELDYDYIIRGSRVPRGRNVGSKRQEQKTEKDARDRERKAEIMGRPCTTDTVCETVAWDDRVARDLGKAFHEVGVEEYEEWVRKGFEVREGEFEGLGKEEEEERLLGLQTGSALRKGSKRR